MEGTGARTHSSLVRDANDHIYEVLLNNGSEDGDFLCECDETACFETVQITLREYAARAEDDRLLMPAHRRRAD